MLINLKDHSGNIVVKDVLDIDFDMSITSKKGQYIVVINSKYDYLEKFAAREDAEDKMLEIAANRNALESELRNY